MKAASCLDLLRLRSDFGYSDCCLNGFEDQDESARPWKL